MWLTSSNVLAKMAAVALLSRKSGSAGNRGNDCAELRKLKLSINAKGMYLIVFIVFVIWFHGFKRKKHILDLQNEL